MALDNPSIQDLIRAASAPCLVLREEDIPQVKKKRDGKAWASEAFARLLRESDAWVDRRIEIPDRGGQWPHWYACESDGAALQAAGPGERDVADADHGAEQALLARGHDELERLGVGRAGQQQRRQESRRGHLLPLDAAGAGRLVRLVMPARAALHALLARPDLHRRDAGLAASLTRALHTM